jgi:homoserine O-acetyltransferase
MSLARCGLALTALLIAAAPALALDAVVEKKTFTLPSYTTTSGKTLKDVKVGWEAYGTLNADKSNAILITHFFSANSHAAGKYKADDKAPGYWDAIIGPGKPLDTDKYYILSVDTLVNLNAKDPNTVTTGPASIDPDTGKPYGLTFPIVTIRDFVNVQKALLDSLGIAKLHAVMGASMGALQVYEWAASYPQMVARAIPVIGGGESDGYLIAWLDLWAAPIRLDPNWNNGDYYGKAEPTAGLATALKMVTLHAQHWAWTNGAAFGAGGGTAADGLKKIDAPVLLITSDDDLVFHADGIKQTADLIRADGTAVEHVKIKGGRGHLDGVIAITQAAGPISAFLAK